jgi:hypothetical protein
MVIMNKSMDRITREEPGLAFEFNENRGIEFDNVARFSSMFDFYAFQENDNSVQFFETLNK